MAGYYVKVVRTDAMGLFAASGVLSGPFDTELEAQNVRMNLADSDRSAHSKYTVVELPFAVRITEPSEAHKNGRKSIVAVYETEIEAKRHVAIAQGGNPEAVCEVIAM